MIVVLLSGGVDSATLLYHALQTGQDVRAVFVNYGQPADLEEARAARAIATSAGVTLEGIYARIHATQLNAGVGVPGPRIVPQRNLLLLGLAANAVPQCTEIWLGATAADHEYRDCSEQFAIHATLALGKTVRVPFSRMTRTDVIARAEELGVPLAAAWSCYQPKRRAAYAPEPCGQCNSCRQGANP